MKRLLLSAILFSVLLLTEMGVNAQYGRVYRRGPVYRSRPMVSVGIGGILGGFYGPRIWGYGWGPHIGVNVVVPPRGVVVRDGSSKAVKQEINGIIYYRRGDIFYREREEGGLVAVEPPVNAALSRLPMGARLQKIEGKYYYEKNGTYYYRDTDSVGRPVYIIVGKNGVLETEDYSSNEGYKSDEYDDQKDNSSITEYEPDISKSQGTVRPQIGDRFEQLPRNSRQVTEAGKKLYVSPNNIYYKEVTEDGSTMYEVVDVK